MVSNRTSGTATQVRRGNGDGPGCGRQKKRIERAYRLSEALGIQVWCEDEAGPYKTAPYPGYSWHPEHQPLCQPHEYIRNGTAKLLTLFQPATGQVRIKGVSNSTNATLPEWFKSQLTEILADQPLVMPPAFEEWENRLLWESWREDLTIKVTLSTALPRLRLLLIMDNLIGHKNPQWLLWCFSQGILPLYTPVAGSWLNMAESIQRLLKRRALNGTYPKTTAEIIAQFEAAARHWNRHPTPFIWAGKRQARRQRAYFRRHPVGASAATTPHPVCRHDAKWQGTNQVTH